MSFSTAPVVAIRQTGKVKWFDDERGYGFIFPDSGGPELFVHHSQVRTDGFRYLDTGERVEFTVGPSMNGQRKQALKVFRTNPSKYDK